ncbi:ABC transporter [Brucella sp. 83/13]|nr:ABC transporter [Brucella sp. 83/13]
MSKLVRLEKLSVRYGREMALQNIDLDIASGEILAVIGESGSGKSTLALALASLLPAGAHVTGGMEWAAGRLQPGRDIGFIFQDPASSFDPLMTVGAQLVETIRAHENSGGGKRRQKPLRFWNVYIFLYRMRAFTAIRTSFPAGRSSVSRLRSPLRQTRAF